jgi:lipopolysaccharide/colanic/teichoic acid biosynthesis glycosyltransferase
VDQSLFRGFSSSVAMQSPAAMQPPASGQAERQPSSEAVEQAKPGKPVANRQSFRLALRPTGGSRYGKYITNLWLHMALGQRAAVLPNLDGHGLYFLAPREQQANVPCAVGDAIEQVQADPIQVPVLEKEFCRSRAGLIQKRAFDLIVAGLLVLLSLPAMLAIGAVIKLTSPGRVLFRQTRQGIDGRNFEILKFRTMYSHLADATAERQTGALDERVTRFGKFLRQSSLDELPQLLNVLGGSMSLVGPRPHALGTAAADGTSLEAADARYASRHRVKPGITGWAQVNGSRGALTTVDQIVDRVDCDLYYIENWSIRLDLKILCKTAWLILRDPDAY